MLYQEFVSKKVVQAAYQGFDIDPDSLHPSLYPHQRDIVTWNVKGGCRAVFASFGLGKTRIAIETVRQILNKEGGKGLFIAPLGVRQEFTRKDGPAMGVDIVYCKNMQEVEACQSPYIITNYERVRTGDIDPNAFTVVSLDEASTLRSTGSDTFEVFMTVFKEIKYKFVYTATPSPNRYLELINYAHFLGVMDRGQALTRFFKRDSQKAGNLKIHPHKEREFWLWLCSWALMIYLPSDLGYSDEGYDLPELRVFWHEIPADHTKAWDKADESGQRFLLQHEAMGIVAGAQEKRETIGPRLEKAKEILQEFGPDNNWLMWHHLEGERSAIEKAFPQSKSVYGSLDLDKRENLIVDFSDGKIQMLNTKPELSGSGCNFQRHCHQNLFLGINYDFNDFIQSIHRTHRFLQDKPVEVHIIHTEIERSIVTELKKKWAQHDQLQQKMREVVSEHGLNQLNMIKALQRTAVVTRQELSGSGWTFINNDCVLETAEMEENSVGLIVTSIPFCYDEETQVLTRRGWLGFGQISVSDDEIATVSSSGKIEYQRPSKVVWEHYDGEMIKFSGRSFNLSVTPNHRMYAARRGVGFGYDKFEFVTADKIATEYEESNRKVEGNARILRGWKMCVVPPNRGDGERPERIMIPPLPPHTRNGHGVEIYWIESADFMRIAGWYLSEGHADSFENSRSGGRLSIGQSPKVNLDNYNDIVDLMVRIGLPPSVGANQISVWCRNLAHFMQAEFGHGCENKRIPRWVLDLHPDLLEIMRDTMMKGDGSKDGTSYASISEELRDAFQEICLKTGWRATVNGTKVVNTGSNQIFPEIRQMPKRVQYSGMIGCATVPNGTLIVRRGGQPCVSGNSNHYEYTPSYLDFGHTDNDNHFFAQMDYLIPNLLRVLQPGRIACIHVKDRMLYSSQTGAGCYTVNPFHAKTMFAFMQHGFEYLGMAIIPTDVVAENNQTYRLGYGEMIKDGTKMGFGSPEFLLTFRKPQSNKGRSYADVPVTKEDKRNTTDPANEYGLGRWQIDADAIWRSSGNRNLDIPSLLKLAQSEDGLGMIKKLYTEYCEKNGYDYEEHVKLAEALNAKGKLPKKFALMNPPLNKEQKEWIWDDIIRMRTLNMSQALRKKEQHVCPLQLDVVDRCILRYSNKGDVVFDPFGGIGTVPVRAIAKGRRGMGTELNADYWKDGVFYLKQQNAKMNVPTLFDALDGGVKGVERAIFAAESLNKK